MRNILLISSLLFDFSSLIAAKVTVDIFPSIVSSCNKNENRTMVDCIRNKVSKMKLSNSSRNIGKLYIKEEFFWHPKKRIRRECRAIPKTEWTELTDAINALKQDKSFYPNVYDHFANLHTNGALINIHDGPNFFGWHRVYILKFEELLRQKNPSVTLCYWDSRLDHNMPYAPASIMFTDRFMGGIKGPVVNGPFAGWKTVQGIPLTRHMDQRGILITSSDVRRILFKKFHHEITPPTAKPGAHFELIHSHVHSFIGGQMHDFNTSAQDPFFWIHHAFIDSIWENFCESLRKRGINPLDDYPNTNKKGHKPNRLMDHLFPIRNIDGYSNYFRNNIYEYEDYAKCPDCLGSPLLKCDKRKNRCRSIELYEPRRKVLPTLKRINTNHLSKPQQRVTILSSTQNMSNWVFVPIKIYFYDVLSTQESEQNITVCQSDLCKRSVVLVRSNGITYQGKYTNYIINDVSIPHLIYVLVGVKNPTGRRSQAYVSITNRNGKPCSPKCLTKNGEYKECPGILSVSSKKPLMFLKNIEDKENNGFKFDPLTTDTLVRHNNLVFHCNAE